MAVYHMIRHLFYFLQLLKSSSDSFDSLMMLFKQKDIPIRETFQVVLKLQMTQEWFFLSKTISCTIKERDSTTVFGHYFLGFSPSSEILELGQQYWWVLKLTWFLE